MLKKTELLNNYDLETKNVGSSAAQIVFINAKIKSVISHLRKNRKDVPAKRAMLKRLARQKTLLAELKKNDSSLHTSLNSRLQEEKKASKNS